MAKDYKWPIDYDTEEEEDFDEKYIPRALPCWLSTEWFENEDGELFDEPVLYYQDGTIGFPNLETEQEEMRILPWPWMSKFHDWSQKKQEEQPGMKIKFGDFMTKRIVTCKIHPVLRVAVWIGEHGEIGMINFVTYVRKFAYLG